MRRRTEEADYREFVASRFDSLRRAAYLLCRDWHTADDLVSITLAKLYRHWRKGREAQNLDAYVRTILTHTWLDERRRPWRREEATEWLPEAALPAAEPTDRAALLGLLGELPPRQRAVVVLRFYCDLSVAQTADILGISEGAVKSQAARGPHGAAPASHQRLRQPGAMMYRNVFDEAIGTAPPSAVNIDGLIERQRRGLRRRRAGAIGASAAAVLVAGSLVWAAPDRSPSPAVPPPSWSASPADDPDAARLAAAARQALLAAAPDVTVEPGSFEMFRSDQPHPTYAGTAIVSVNGQRGRLSITIMQGRVTELCALPADCQPVTGPHGESGTLLSTNGTSGGLIGCHIVLDRSAVDGTSVQIDVNGVRSASGTTGDMPLTVDQVIRMAEDPALHLAP